MLKEFKAFILRGNVVDLAIAVVIGMAFSTVIKAFISGMVTPLLAIPGDAASLADMKFEISGSQFLYGSVLDAIVYFVIVAAVLFFFVVRPVNLLMARRKTEPEMMAMTRDCPYCLSSIPVAATRCAFCTANVPSVA
jgi:large conductance mechanosensitive channel